MQRVALALALAFTVPVAAGLGCSLEQLGTGRGGAAEGGVADSGDAGDAAIATAGCGADVASGVTLCRATAQCPNLVVDPDAFPNCGFRVRGAVVDLVCACSGAICSMGTYDTCAEAAALLASQQEPSVCVQVAEDKCTTAPRGPSSTTNPTCDRACLRDCGGGAACAALCNCS